MDGAPRDEPAPLPVYELGLDGDQRDRLVERVLAGAKTMTSGLLVHLQMDDEELPLPGQRYALVDSRGHRGTIEIIEVRLRRLVDVGDEVARAEGEDFVDAAHWRRVHEDFWSRWDDEVARHLGRQTWTAGDEDVVVLEQFRLVP